MKKHKFSIDDIFRAWLGLIFLMLLAGHKIDLSSFCAMGLGISVGIGGYMLLNQLFAKDDEEKDDEHWR